MVETSNEQLQTDFMSILVVGSVAFDTIATPSGRVENILGGAATYFALAASYFTDVRMVAVVGEDFTAENEAENLPWRSGLSKLEIAFARRRGGRVADRGGLLSRCRGHTLPRVRIPPSPLSFHVCFRNI